MQNPQASTGPQTSILGSYEHKSPIHASACLVQCPQMTLAAQAALVVPSSQWTSVNLGSWLLWHLLASVVPGNSHSSSHFLSFRLPEGSHEHKPPTHEGIGNPPWPQEAPEAPGGFHSTRPWQALQTQAPSLPCASQLPRLRSASVMPGSQSVSMNSGSR